MEDINLEHVLKATAVEDLYLICLAWIQGPALASPDKHVDNNRLEPSDPQVDMNVDVAL